MIVLQQAPAGGAPQVNVGVGVIWHSVMLMARAVLARIPYIVVALIVFLLFWATGRIIKAVVARVTREKGRGEPAAVVFSRLASFGLVIIGVAVAAVIVFPEFTFGGLLGALGIGSVAIGFAFQNILQNFLAGILLLWRRPFYIGDQIRSGSFEGTVLQIDIRSTRIKTYDGELVILPNSDVFTNAMIVRTAFANRRVRLDIPVDFGQSLDDARAAITKVVNETEGVLQDPGPWVYTTGVGQHMVITAYFWTGAEQKTVLEVTDRVATAIDHALRTRRVDLAPPTDIRLHQAPARSDGSGGGAPGAGSAGAARSTAPPTSRPPRAEPVPQSPPPSPG